MVQRRISNDVRLRRDGKDLRIRLPGVPSFDFLTLAFRRTNCA